MILSTSLFQIVQQILLKVIRASFSIKTQLALLIYKILQFWSTLSPLLICPWKMEFVKSSWMNLIFCLFQTWIWQATQAEKIKFKIDKKSGSSNMIFQTQFFQKSIGGSSIWNPLMNKLSKIIWPHCVTCHMDHHGLIAMSRISWDEFQNVKRKKISR